MSYLRFFHRSHPTKFDMHSTLDGIVQEHVGKLLGIFFSDKLSFEDHVNFVLTVYSQRIQLLKLLRSQGLQPKQLQSADSIYCPDTVTHYICCLSLGRPSHQSAKAALLMPSRNEPESLGLLRQCIVSKTCWRSLINFQASKNSASCIYPILPCNNQSRQLILKKKSAYIYPSALYL